MVADFQKREKISTQMGNTKGRERKELRWDLCSWEEAVKEEWFLYSEKFPCWKEDQLGQRGSLRTSEESTATRWRATWSETCVGGQSHCLELPSLEYSSLGEREGWVLRLRLQRPEPQKRLCGDSLRGRCSVPCHNPGVQEEAWAHSRGRVPQLEGVQEEGQGTHRSFSPCVHSQVAGHHLQELREQAPATAAISDSRAGHGPQIPPDPTTGLQLLPPPS